MFDRLRRMLKERGLRRSLSLLFSRVIDVRAILALRSVDLHGPARRALLNRLSHDCAQPHLTLVLRAAGPSAVNLIPRLKHQSFDRFLTIVVPDTALDAAVLTRLHQQAAADGRVTVTAPQQLSADPLAFAAARDSATTPYVVFCDAGARLTDDAAALLTAAALTQPAPAVVYGDDDSANRFGLPERTRLRPAWSLHHLRERDYIEAPLMIQRSLLQELPDLRTQDTAGALLELLLHAAERREAPGFRNLPYRLARRPRPYRPPARSPAATTLVKAHLQRSGIAAELLPVADRPDLTRLNYALPTPPPVTIIVPTRDRLDLLRPCVESVLQKTDYPDLELIIIDNGSREAATAAFFAELQTDRRVRVLHDDGEFNYAAMNNRAAAIANGSLLCLLNNDTEAIEPDWLTGLVSLALQPGAATVGPLLLYPDGNIQCMGVTTGPVYPATTIGTGSVDYQRRHNLLWCTRGVIANTAACLVVRKELFLAGGGFDETLRIDFNDVELGLRLHRQGYVNLWTPHVRVLHRHGASRGRHDTPAVYDRRMREAAHLTRGYPDLIGNDPFFRTLQPQSHRPADAPRTTRNHS